MYFHFFSMRSVPFCFKCETSYFNHINTEFRIVFNGIFMFDKAQPSESLSCPGPINDSLNRKFVIDVNNVA